jgi:hypothetical protein
MLFEFENSYNLNTGDLLEIFYGSGVHLQKDVTLSFSFIDPQGNVIGSDLELRNNPLIKDISYDILNTNRETLYENYKIGSTRTFSFKEIENIALFGQYEKDFGIRAVVSNFINDNKFISEYYVYGNVPKISGVFLLDGSGFKIYNDDLSYNIINSGFIYDKIELEINFLNNSQYISYDYIDIYKSDNENIEIVNDNFIYRYPIVNSFDLFKIEIDRNYLNTGFSNLAIIPYSKIGSGDVFYLNNVFLKENETPITPIDSPTVNELKLGSQDEIVKINVITGYFNSNNNEIIDIIEKNHHKVIKYTTEIYNNNKISSSELKIIIHDSKFNSIPSLIEYGFGENNFINYELQTGESNLYLIANGGSKGSFYKLYKTSM